jgi:hypothetical protein
MPNLSISRAWTESAAFVAREASLLMPVAFAFVGLPSVIFGQFAPEVVPGQTPEAGAWMLLMIPMLLLSVLGGLTLNNLVLRPGITVGEAIRAGVPRMLPLIGAALLLMVAGAIATVPVLILAAVLSGGNVTAGAGIMLFLMMPIFLIVAIRMMFMNPVAAMEAHGPVAMLVRSWRLSRGHSLKLLVLLAAFLVILFAASIAASAIFGIAVTLTIGAPADEPISRLILELVSAMLSTVFSVYLATMIARLYAQISAD